MINTKLSNTRITQTGSKGNRNGMDKVIATTTAGAYVRRASGCIALHVTDDEGRVYLVEIPVEDINRALDGISVTTLHAAFGTKGLTMLKDLQDGLGRVVGVNHS